MKFPKLFKWYSALTNKSVLKYSLLRLSSFVFMLFFTVACSKDSSIVENQIPDISEEEIEFRDKPTKPDDGCRCYMSIRSVSGIPGAAATWSFTDGTYGNSDFDINGQGENYSLNGVNGPFYTFPTPYLELNSPSSGSHTFYLAVLNFPPTSNFAVNTTYKCYYNGLLENQINKSFIWGEGDRFNHNDFFRFFTQPLVCHFVSHGGG